MNFKNVTYREISQLLSSCTTYEDIDEAIAQLDGLIASLKLLRNTLEGRKALQRQKDKIKQRRGLKVVPRESNK
jgi:hypothetical protein